MLSVNNTAIIMAKILPESDAQLMLEELAKYGDLKVADLNLVMYHFESRGKNKIDFGKILDYINIYEALDRESA